MKDWPTKRMSLSDLTPADYNPRKISDKSKVGLTNSLDRFGLVQPIVWNKRTGNIVGGHQRYSILVEKGTEDTDVVVVDLDNEDEIALNIALNNPTIQGDWSDSLAEVLAQYTEEDFFGELGFDDLADQLKIIFESDDTEGETDEDKVPEQKGEIYSEYGKIYQLGEHRLMCGSSTDKEDVDKLMNGERAQMCFTSPPYNVGITPNDGDNKYLNDEDSKTTDEYTNFLVDFTENFLEHSDYAFVNIQSVSGNKMSLIDYQYRMKKNFADMIIWDKMMAEPAMHYNILNSRFEYIYIFSHDGTKRTVGIKYYRGTEENIFQLNSRQEKDFAKVHKATFPTSFPFHFVKTFTEEGKIVTEPFNGTGTTIIACEKANRICYAMDMEPLYCDIARKRWADFVHGEGCDWLELTPEI